MLGTAVKPAFPIDTRHQEQTVRESRNIVRVPAHRTSRRVELPGQLWHHSTSFRSQTISLPQARRTPALALPMLGFTANRNFKSPTLFRIIIPGIFPSL